MGKGEDRFRVQVILAVALGPVGLTKPEVDLVAAPPAGMAEDPVEDAPAVFVFVKTQRLKVVQGAGRLGDGIAEGVLDIAGEGIAFSVAGVPQKGYEVPGGGQADSGHHGVFRRVGELVDVALLEGRSLRVQADFLAAG